MLTPYDFGKHVGKQAFVMLPGMLGAGLGAITAPTGQASGLQDAQIRAESIGRGAAKGTGAGLGLTAGALLATMLTKGRLKIPRGSLTAAGQRAANTGSRLPYPRGIKPSVLLAEAMKQKILPRVGGTLGGGVAGYTGADALLGKPSWEQGK
jgi:hypothetical protein